MSLPTFNGPASENVRMFFMDCARVLYRRRWLAIPVFVSIVVAVVIYNARAARIYQARASVLIDFDEPNVINFQKVLDESPAFGNYAQTQHELLQSRALVQRTVNALKLTSRPGFTGMSEENAINMILGDLQIVPVRATRIVNVQFRGRDPQLAAEIVNAHVDQYVEQSLEKRFLASTQATEWLDAQLAEERKRVEAAESALQTFRERHDALSLEEGQNIVVQKLADINAAVTRAKTNRIEKESQYRELQAARRDPYALDAFPAILANSFVQQLKGDLATLQREYAQLSETLGDLHPTMVEKRTAIQTAEKRLAAEIARIAAAVENEYQAAMTAEQGLTRALDEQKAEAQALNRRSIDHAALEREAASVRQVYQTLLQRAKETSVSRELRATNVQIVDAARPPRQPIRPRKTFNLVMAALVGTLLAVGTAFVTEIVDDRVKVPGDVTGELRQLFLGLIPQKTVRGRRRVSLARRDAPRVMIEAFRGIRTNVLSAMPREGSRSLLIASASQGEGKTSIAGNLAVALAQAQHRVLLIDADMRRPQVHDQLELQLVPGLSNVLNGTASVNDALQSSSVPGLTVLAGGNPTDKAPELLGSTRFEELLKILGEHYDWVVIDSPPALMVTDASIIARYATGVVFVVGSSITRVRAAIAALEELQRAGGRVLGTVLNRAQVERHSFYFAPYSASAYVNSLDAPAVDASTTTSTKLAGGA
jgi:capsular exopolysaccharide synthesis family protein